jgi:hypothetical protein
VDIAGRVFHDDGGPLVFEQYVKSANLTDILKRKAYIEGTYGKCRIARLVFVPED